MNARDDYRATEQGTAGHASPRLFVFARHAESAANAAALALGARPVPVSIEPGLDDIQAGHLDGRPLEDYWAWKENHALADPFPGGESVDDARIRYAAALRRLLTRTERVTLIILHELALRWIAETATGSRLLPDAALGNAMPYLFEKDAVERATVGLEELARPVAGSRLASATTTAT